MNVLIGSLQSKTMWFAAALALLGFVQGNWGLFSPLFSANTAGWLVGAIGIVVGVLRILTGQPLSVKRR